MSGTDAAFEIAPGQGFFVEAGSAATASDNITFDVNDISHQSETFQKTTIRPTINLTLSEGKNERNATLYYIEETTKGFDNGFDGKLFGGVSHSLAIFTDLVESDGKKYQVQSLPNSDFDSMVVPVGIIAGANKTFTISANSENLPKGIDVYLEDRVAGTFTLLDKNNSFSFTGETELDGTGRFYLHTTSQVLNIDDTILNNSIAIYTIGKELQLVGLRNITNTVNVYNILGKQIIQKTFTNGGNKSISLGNIKTGVYIIKVKNNTGSISKKVIVE